MTRRNLANRRHELELYARLLAGQSNKRILLIQAESGTGKTELLGQFRAECPDAHAFVLVDLKKPTTGMTHVFWKISSSLGTEHFTQFASILTKFDAPPLVNIAGNRTFGLTNIHAVLNVDEKARPFRLESLHQAFFEDLRAYPRQIAIVFDTFNDAVDEVHHWLGVPFLADLRHLPHACVVIAGQQVPERSAEWMDMAEFIQLGGIHDVDAWQEFLDDLGLTIPRDVIFYFIKYLHGHPKQLFEAFKAISGEGRA